jgi:WD40 repeat protein
VVLFWQLEPSSPPYLVHICDRHGTQIFLRGHTSSVFFLSFSNDGNYLASAGCSDYDKSIRIWPTKPTTRLPQQSDKTLPRGTKTLSLAWIFHPATQVSRHLGTLVLLSSFGMLNRKYACTVLITAVDLSRLCTFLLSTTKAKNAPLYQRLGR